MSGGIGSTGETYDFFNRTLLPGNFSAVPNVVNPNVAAVDPTSGRVFVGGQFFGGISVVDAVNSSVEGFINTIAGGAGLGSTALAIDPNRGELFSVDSFDQNLTVINTKTLAMVGHVFLGGFGTAVVCDPENGEVYVAVGTLVRVVSEANDTVVGTIPIGLSTDGLAYDPLVSRLFVADSGTGNVTIVDTTTNLPIQTVFSGSLPGAIVSFSPAGLIYVANIGSQNLTVLNASTGAYVASIPTAFAPQDLAAVPSDGFVYADNFSTNTVAAIGYRTNVVTTLIHADFNPTAMAYDPVTGDLLALEYSSDNLTRINPSTNAVTGSIRIGYAPYAVAYDSHDAELGITLTDADTLVILNATTFATVATIAVGRQPTAVTYDTVNECFYVANSQSNTVSVVNGSTRSLVTTVTVGTGPLAIAYVAAFNYLYVETNQPFGGKFSLTTINGANNQVVGHVAVSTFGLLSGLAYDPVNGNLYVGTAAGQNITVVHALTGAVVATIPYGAFDLAFAADPYTGNVYVASLFNATTFTSNQNLTLLNGSSNTVAKNISTGAGSGFVLDYNSANGDVYVGNWNWPNLTVVNGTTGAVLGAIPIGGFANGMADDGKLGQIFVANEFSGSISVVSLPDLGRYPINFTETGLPAGQLWSVTTAGKTLSTTTATIVAVVPDGGTPFTVLPPPGYNATPNSSSVNVAGGVVEVQIVFARLPTTYSVNFAETGLASGLNWSVTLDSTRLNSTLATITLPALNGSHPYLIGPPTGYDATPSTGSVSVSGHDALVNVTFVLRTTGTVTPTGGGSSSFGAIEGFAFAGAAALVGAGVGAVVARRPGRPPASDESSPE